MLKLCRVIKLKVFFLLLVYVFNFDLFKFSSAILENGLLGDSVVHWLPHWTLDWACPLCPLSSVSQTRWSHELAYDSLCCVLGQDTLIYCHRVSFNKGHTRGYGWVIGTSWQWHGLHATDWHQSRPEGVAVPPVATETEAKRRPDKLPTLTVDLYADFCIQLSNCLPLNTIQSSLEASGLGRHAIISWAVSVN